ncbi:unnamed protein product [Acanthoscelides obtectus]|uniref:Uncharacterized protein n=1 Tax=Acanthoscelides obtectus TaxID=200917 RepID=A0A9P0JNY0_ACAOB|nr:unnamed protein product [Acanthoscelides obtectus]CAK1667955.1 hypothetical protein AOBTE_LOCUS26136 [Acanthoscelides obtectus]
MNAGPLPPVPALIPISALRKAAGNNGRQQEMGEQQQRPLRPSPNQPRIDSCGGGERQAAKAAAAKATVARKTQRSTRHHRRKCRTPRATTQPQNRINPIFVWVKQEDTRIVDVKCEDYDKRNRILLTKTAQGWRAIPRTETLVPSLKDVASVEEHATHHHHHHHHKSKKSRKNKVRRRSTGVQVTSDLEEDEPEQDESETKEDDLESLLPSHTIKVNRAVTPQKHDEDVEVNVNVNTTAATVPTSDVTPLDNLLAVAELEFNQQVRSGEWEEKSEEQGDKEFNLDLIEPTKKSEECDYTEEDENNIAMDDILSRLEQSLQSPECTEVHTNFESEVITKVDDENANHASDNETIVPEFQSDPKPEIDIPQKEIEEEEPLLPVVESSTVDDEEPKDLTVKSTEANDNDCDELDEPTDLSIPKKSSSPPPRPVSQNSEAIQSPQPSGIPAVPPSPDIVSTTVNSKSKSVFLESLLANNTNKIELNSEVTITRQAEPLDLGKCSRKSASPTVTCSEEVSSAPEPQELEPPTKKLKPSIDLTVKNLLDVEEHKSSDAKSKEKSQTETPRLIELLKNDSEPDALVQLKQLLADPSINVPDPILIPKDKFTTILMKPGTEIPKLLKERPELRLPEALAYPHIMQDPHMLVLNVHDLEAILASRCGQESSEKEKSETKKAEKEKDREKESAAKEKGEHQKAFNELANDIDMATQSAFNQMLWLPYLNQLEAMGYNANAELMKMLTGSMPFYPNQMADLSHMFGNSPFPPNLPFPMQQLNYGNLIEMRMWQQAMMQADMLRNKSAMESMNNKYAFKDYLEKNSHNQIRKSSGQTSLNQMMQASNKQHFSSGSVYSNGHSGYQNPYMNPHQSNSNGMSSQRSNHRNNSYPQRQHSNNSYQQKQLEANQHLYNLAELEKQQHYMQSLSGLNQEYNIPQRREPHQKPKVTCKPFASLSNKPVESRSEFTRHPLHHGPMDLSGIPSLASKQKIKQHHMDQVIAAKAQAMKHHEDVPEVGSTTASIEEMQDAHKHLWHPLFGSQQGQQGSKGYPIPGMGAYGGVGSPWPWPGLTAGAGAGE